MTPSMVAEIVRHVLLETFWLSLPLLAIGFAAGIVVSLLQIVTSMQDASLGTIPRLAAYLLGLVLLLPWMLTRLVSYTTHLLGDFSRYAR